MLYVSSWRSGPTESLNSISKTLGNTHRACSRSRNQEAGVTGHLWANRFYSTALDEPYVWAAVRYVELNPVRARLVGEATDYAWSSARANAGLQWNPLLNPERPFPGHIGDWAAWLKAGHPMAKGFKDALDEPKDVWYRPYDLDEGNEAAMQTYLGWEVDLTKQIERDGTANFLDFGAAGEGGSL